MNLTPPIDLACRRSRRRSVAAARRAIRDRGARPAALAATARRRHPLRRALWQAPPGSRRCAAIDGDAGGHGLELVDRRSLEAREELAHVRAEALDEAALALGVERIHRERRLAGARHASDGDELAGLEGLAGVDGAAAPVSRSAFCADVLRRPLTHKMQKARSSGPRRLRQALGYMSDANFGVTMGDGTAG